jgi:DICT domain-containing protein
VRGEWDIAVIGPHYAAALVARDVGDAGPDHLRRFDYVLTHDRELVVQVASRLMGRMQPAR